MVGRSKAVNLNVFVVLLAGYLLLFSSCTKYVGQGAGVGAAVGAAAGALLDEENRWRGAAIGSALGAVFGGTIADVSTQASREAVREGRTVAYQSEDGYRRIEASPQGIDRKTNCHKVRERVWEDGKLVKDSIREVCKSDKSENVY